MKELIKLSDNLLNMKSNLDKIVEQIFERRTPDYSPEQTDMWRPDVNVIENKDEIKIYVLLPFAKKENISVSLKDNILTIDGESKWEIEKNDEILREEIPSGKFSRTFKINFPVKNENIKASYKDGILTLIMPKDEKAKATRINIE